MRLHGRVHDRLCLSISGILTRCRVHVHVLLHVSDHALYQHLHKNYGARVSQGSPLRNYSYLPLVEELSK